MGSTCVVRGSRAEKGCQMEEPSDPKRIEMLTKVISLVSFSLGGGAKFILVLLVSFFLKMLCYPILLQFPTNTRRIRLGHVATCWGANAALRSGRTVHKHLVTRCTAVTTLATCSMSIDRTSNHMDHKQHVLPCFGPCQTSTFPSRHCVLAGWQAPELLLGPRRASQPTAHMGPDMF